MGERKKPPCYYTFGSRCPGITTNTKSRKVQEKCIKCPEFNGNTGEVRTYKLVERGKFDGR